MFRIDKIDISNYRQYKDFSISFERASNKNDLHIIIGENDTGKTNLLNAINWCLYGDEPHLGKQQEEMPLLNTNVIKNSMENGASHEVKVEIVVSTDNNHILRFKRNHNYRVHPDQKEPVFQEENYTIYHIFPKGETNIYENEKAQERVNQFIPKHLRRFFFFDGEEIKSYFEKELASQIKQHVFALSNIDFLKRIENRLSICRKDIRKKISKLTPKLKEIENKLETIEKRLDSLEKKRKNAEKQRNKAKKKYEALREKLSNLPDVEKIQNKIDKFTIKRDEKEIRKKELIERKNKILLKYLKLFNILTHLNNVLFIIEQKQKTGEYPPPYDSKEVKKSIKNDECGLCGRPLDERALKNLKNILKSLEIHSIINSEIRDIEPTIKSVMPQISAFKDQRDEINDIIKDYDNDIQEINKTIKNLDSILSGHDDEKIVQWHKQMKNWKTIYIESRDDIVRLQVDIDSHKEKEEELEKELDYERKKVKRAEDMSVQKEFTKVACEKVKKMRKSIMDDTKNEIEERTKKIFFDLIWKTKTYKDVVIDDNYNVRLVHSLDYSCYGTAGAAVRQFLALAFTLALQEISGFETQLIIDTPVGRTSGVHRENLATAMKKVSQYKQCILLFTPDEYDNKISEELDNITSNRYRLRMIKEENETLKEELSKA